MKGFIALHHNTISAHRYITSTNFRGEHRYYCPRLHILGTSPLSLEIDANDGDGLVVVGGGGGGGGGEG